MPRRAPKKPDPSLDLSAHLRVLASDPVFRSPPLDPRALFPRAGADVPCEVEIGSGKGLFLGNASAAEPGRVFVGVEISHGYARMAAGRLARQSADNALVISGDAGVLVRGLLPDACLQGMHVYFPDPWWKARHRKRRVLSPEFLAHAGRVLCRGGLLHVWTDVEEYFREAMAAAADSGVFLPPEEVGERGASHDLDYRTHFERRTRLAGEPVWRARLERSDRPATVARVEPPATPGGSSG